MMLHNPEPEDFVVGTGESHSVREFVHEAFSYVGLDWQKYVQIDHRYFRPLEPGELTANSQKANEVLGWKPKVAFRELVRIMVDADMRRVGLKPYGEGDAALSKRFEKRWWTVD